MSVAAFNHPVSFRRCNVKEVAHQLSAEIDNRAYNAIRSRTDYAVSNQVDAVLLFGMSSIDEWDLMPEIHRRKL